MAAVMRADLRCIACTGRYPKSGSGGEWLWLETAAGTHLGPFCSLLCRDEGRTWSHDQRLASIFGDAQHGHYLHHLTTTHRISEDI